MIEIPAITSLVISDQTITREFTVGNAGDGRFDLTPQYGRSGKFRPTRIRFVYRVNMGASSPFWYLFQVKITAAKVLKDGSLSEAYSNIITETMYPERVPMWVQEMGTRMKPHVEIERARFGAGQEV